AVLGVALRDARATLGALSGPGRPGRAEHAHVQRLDRGAGLAVESARRDQPANAGVEREALPLVARARVRAGIAARGQRARRLEVAEEPRRHRTVELGERLAAAGGVGDHVRPLARAHMPLSSRAAPWRARSRGPPP